MKYFDIPTIKSAIEGLEEIRGNWLIPAFVFAANDVGSTTVDMSQAHGTDKFLDRYFNGELLGLEPFPNGTNLLRPRMKDVTLWKANKKFEGDYVIQQGTKLWANLLSSRGYREMDQRGYIRLHNNLVALEPSFQTEFENQIPASFSFEDFMVWLFAFRGVPDDVQSWQQLFDHLLTNELGISQLQPPYRGRFKLANPTPPWPTLLAQRPTDEEFLNELAPALVQLLADEAADDSAESGSAIEPLSEDDQGLNEIRSAISRRESFAFLLAGPPGTGKTRYARQLDVALTGGNPARSLFLQFHPTLGYDDFVEGFRPVSGEDGKGITYKLEKRLLLKFCEDAKEARDELHVLVIDEINRGDVARVFGELLTYLEADYRDVQFNLSISGDEITLPENVIVIATANPYDRSVTDLDDALLRRFWVIEMDPSEQVLENHLNEKGVEPSVVRRTLHLFRILNRVFPAGFGHTSFLKVRTIEDLHAVWSGRVRLALKRTLLHDPKAREETIGEIEGLLDVSEAEAAGESDEAIPPEDEGSETD